MHTQLKKSSAGGFSFIELLLVVLLVSMAFVVFLGALSSNKQVNAQTRIKTTQAIMLNDIQEQIRSRRFDEITSGSLSNTLGPDHIDGSMLNFSGGNHEVKITGANFISGNEARSISVWADGSSGNVVSLGHGNNNNQRFSILISNRKVLIIGQGNDWSVNFWLIENQMNHIVVTHDGSTVRLYANGVFQQSTNKSYNTNVSMPIMIGTNCDNRNDEWFNGTIDDVVITRDALSSDEVMALYNKTDIDLDNVVGAYDFDEGSGSVLNDISGNGNNGAITGATWVSNNSSLEGSISDFNDIDDFNGYNASQIDGYPGFSLSVQVDYVDPGSKFRTVMSSPTNYKRVITAVGHDAEQSLLDTLIFGSGL